jgi:hypothetical protein
MTIRRISDILSPERRCITDMAERFFEGKSDDITLEMRRKYPNLPEHMIVGSEAWCRKVQAEILSGASASLDFDSPPQAAIKDSTTPAGTGK